ncbi:loganic acid O-methyltransferase-like isoform X2 [Ziziphus jujuba]|uniref:Loganic acid O-methyltransferase-like isoform X2 n=1 Tax=Ziziphus jujuba TaxID=326968 RepID=A0ABM3II56_ZIZJJ|nr:loganic acid O-methyltransferase-like isoform X2 [Ziziphus jujuba]
MEMPEAYPMKGGDGLHSYAKNSYFHRGIIDVAKQFLNEVIAEKLDIGTVVSSKAFCIADLGCSVGPNTFAAVENIIEAVKSKYQSQGLNSKIPEFQVFFNDHVSNDFNLLFTSLPQDKKYYASGVPGSFYGRIFPEASLHFVHSSFSVQWLSGVPKEVKNKSSPAWNKGQIHYANSGDEVIRAYKAQYEKDMDQFLEARAHEIVVGGLMVLMFLFNPDGIHPSQSSANMMLDLIGSSLIDLVKEGKVDEEKVDSFNVPMYFMSPKELEAAVERNGCFSIERMENIPLLFLTGNTSPVAHKIAAHMRAGMEDMIKQQFGDDIVDELFDLYAKKVDKIFIPCALNSSIKGGNLFVMLKRKA